MGKDRNLEGGDEEEWNGLPDLTCLYQTTIGQRLIIDFVVISDLQPYVLDTRMNREQSCQLITTEW